MCCSIVMVVRGVPMSQFEQASLSQDVGWIRSVSKHGAPDLKLGIIANPLTPADVITRLQGDRDSAVSKAAHERATNPPVAETIAAMVEAGDTFSGDLERTRVSLGTLTGSDANSVLSALMFSAKAQEAYLRKIHSWVRFMGLFLVVSLVCGFIAGVAASSG